MSTSFNQSISQTLTPKKTNLIAPLLLILGLVLCLSAAAYGYIESRRTERIVIAAREIPFGQQITADDLATLELPLHRPIQLAGITEPERVIGKWITRSIGPNDLLQPTMLADQPLADPVYPNGQMLGRNMVPVPFALQALGPITDRDRVNIGFTTTDASLCDREAADVPPGTVLPPPALATEAASGDGRGNEPQPLARAYACRFMSSVRILYIDSATAYLEMSPTQAHAMWALQAAGVQIWGERYGSESVPLMYMDRMDAAQVTLPDLTAPVSDTVRIEPLLVQPELAAIPGATIPETKPSGASANAEQP